MEVEAIVRISKHDKYPKGKKDTFLITPISNHEKTYHTEKKEKKAEKEKLPIPVWKDFAQLRFEEEEETKKSFNFVMLHSAERLAISLNKTQPCIWL